MRDPTEVSTGAASTTQDVDSLYIITLSSSLAPVSLEAPAIPELTGLAIFRSRRVEDGRDRFRLHLGYFDSVAAAEAILPAVRKHYPAAWVGPAPKSGMGSLDDTSVAQFKFIRAPKTIQREAPAHSMSATITRAPRAPTPAPRAISATLVAPRSAQSAASAGPPGPTAPKPAAARARAESSRQGPVTRNPSAPLAPREMLNLLESPPSRPAPAAKSPVQPMERAAVIGAIQRFAVQIVWSMDPVDLAHVPKLAIFDAYTLYKVQVDRAGRRWYGLRLGFFGDPVSARQVALYARSDFSAAAVVPVSDRECQRAEEAAITEFPVPDAKKPEEPMKLLDEPPAARNPAKNAIAARAQKERRAKKVVEQTAQAPVRASPSLARTTQELADEFEGVPDFSGGDDALNDSGVRHLAVRIVEKRSGLSGFFSRGGRDKRKH